MAEVYPSDSELLNIVSEAETGVEYIPTGTAPYYLHFRKLLLASRRGNDLRVFDEENLGIGVKAGKFWVGMTSGKKKTQKAAKDKPARRASCKHFR
jgi:hypothetical protein